MTGGWQIVWSDEPPRQARATREQKTRARAIAGTGFCAWMSCKEARLAPVVNFKGRAAKPVS